MTTEHFKMEGIHMLKDLRRAGDWMAKIDFKDREFLKYRMYNFSTAYCWDCQGTFRSGGKHDLRTFVDSLV